MIFLQALWFNVTFYAANLVMSTLLSGALFFPRKIIVKAVWVWLSVVAKVENHCGGIKYRVLGRENIPQGACIVACKHQSEWETFKLHLIFNDPAIVLKRELLKIPLIGCYMRRSGSIAIDRGGGASTLRRMTAAAKRALAQGRSILIFPEGTRVGVGESRPYKSGVAALYRELNLPIVPVALNSGLLWPKNSFYKKRGTITVEILSPLPPGLPREEMMQKLREALESASARLLESAPCLLAKPECGNKA